MYLHSETEQIYICGDFNSRIGHLNDTIDFLPKRNVLDKQFMTMVKPGLTFCWVLKCVH